MIRKVKKTNPDTRSVDIDDFYSLEYWTKEFGVSVNKLKAAVLAAGSEALDVRRELNKPNTMKAEKPKIAETGDKDHLSQDDLKAGIKTFEQTDKPHAALETPDGKNNGAEPAVYQNQRKSQT
jgi:hypothetical protein